MFEVASVIEQLLSGLCTVTVLGLCGLVIVAIIQMWRD